MPERSPLSSFRVRPRFQLTVAATPEIARKRVLEGLAALPDGVVLREFPGLIGLHFAEAERHAWSPRLLVHFESRGDGLTVIEGVYGPEIEVWSVFVYGYFFSGMIGVFSVILGGAQWFIGNYPWALWVTAGMGVLAVALYIAAQFGQKLGAAQTVRLHHIWESAHIHLCGLKP